jgi:hypothetical protein
MNSKPVKKTSRMQIKQIEVPEPAKSRNIRRKMKIKKITDGLPNSAFSIPILGATTLSLRQISKQVCLYDGSNPLL